MGYEVFYTASELAALAAEETAAGLEVAAALAAVELAVAAAPIVVLGAGIGGLILGKQLYDKYFPGKTPPNLLPPVSGGQANTSYRVFQHYKLKGQPANDDPFPTPLQGPIYGYSYEARGDSLAYYINHAINEKAFTIQAPKDAFEDFPVITSIQRLDGLPDPGNMPRNFQDTPIPEFPIRVPTPIVLPGESTPTIITPEVYPSPALDPVSPEEEKVAPGVLVKIPETGSQIQITPTGGYMTRYVPSSPTTGVATEPPKPTTDKKVAVDPCPCPETKVDLKEVICRLKALESGLLDDGFQYTTNIGPSGQGAVRSDITDELVYVSLQINQFSSRERTQRSAPGTPTVYFIGWFSWLIGQFPSERFPISYLNHNFIAPQGATGYLFSLHDGASASSSFITRRRKDYIDLC